MVFLSPGLKAHSLQSIAFKAPSIHYKSLSTTSSTLRMRSMLLSPASCQALTATLGRKSVLNSGAIWFGLHARPLARYINASSSNVGSVRNGTAQDILANQRLNRPVAPHLSIYRPQITWISSMLNRITGVLLAGIIYFYSVTYLVAPSIGWHIDSASMAAGFAAWPIVAKIATKAAVAWPFVYHSFNGIRHLVWDFGYNLDKRKVIQSGWAVAGLSVVGAISLVAGYM